jgi:hypothetical protein
MFFFYKQMQHDESIKNDISVLIDMRNELILS